MKYNNLFQTLKVSILKISIGILFITLGSISLFGQAFNITPKSKVSGMPGNVYNDVWGYTDAQGKEYAIVGSSAAINIYDVTDCANPIQKMTYLDTTGITWRDFKTYQNYAYAVCDGIPCIDGLQIINLDNYTVTQDVSTFSRAHNIFIDVPNGRLYVVGSNASNGQITIYTLDTEIVNGVTYAGTPANPVLLKKFSTSYIHDIYVKDNIAYASHGTKGYIMWDVSNPANITQLASNLDASGYNHSSWVSTDGQYAYVAEEVPRGRPLKIFKITGTGLGTSVNLIDTFRTPLEAPLYYNNRPHNPFVKGDTLFVSYYEDGVQVFDISQPLLPKRIAYYDTYTLQNGLGYSIPAHDWKGPWGVYPFLPSGCILASDITQGLFTFKVNISPSQGATTSRMAEMDNADLVFQTLDKGPVLVSPTGNCYRVAINLSGDVITQQIICHTNGEPLVSLSASDLTIASSAYGIILKNTSTTCAKITINTSGMLVSQTASCISTPQQIIIADRNLLITNPAYGLIMSDSNNICYRICVDQNGLLVSTPLTNCP
ncbi:MAG: choice-of-anchor B family protein [Saprospiraceae bacterium]